MSIVLTHLYHSRLFLFNSLYTSEQLKVMRDNVVKEISETLQVTTIKYRGHFSHMSLYLTRCIRSSGTKQPLLARPEEPKN